MEADPNFPDRPTHEDFELLSKLIMVVDEMAVAGQSFEVIAEMAGVDVESMTYMLQGRMAMLDATPKTPSLRAKVSWMDGFILGALFGAVKGQRP